VVKEADVLAEVGHEVEVLGMNTLPHLVDEDRELVRGKKWNYTAVPGPLDPANKGKTFRYRLTRRIANELATRTGIQTVAQLGGWRKDLLREALKRKADLTMAHSASTLWVARELMKRGRKVAVDFEDWFSRENGKASWHPDRVVARLEKELLITACHATCTSEAMAEAIGKAYGRKPEVIYNVFPLADAPQPAPEPGPEGPKVLWISQALGPGRGLELLVEALHFCRPSFKVTLVGNPQGTYQSKLQSKLPAGWKRKVSFQKQVPDKKVLECIAGYHIGLALELRDPENRDVTISNKIFQYLLGGLAVAATSTRGQMEIANLCAGAVRTCEPDDPKAVAKVLMNWAENPEQLRQDRAMAKQAAIKKFSWEHESGKIVRLVSRSCR